VPLSEPPAPAVLEAAAEGEAPCVAVAPLLALLLRE